LASVRGCRPARAARSSTRSAVLDARFAFADPARPFVVCTDPCDGLKPRIEPTH
jgi:hypothetical protein